MTILYAGILLVLAVVLFLGYRLLHASKREPKEILLAKAFGKILDNNPHEVLEEMRDLYKETDQDVGVGIALGTLFRRLGKNRMAIRQHKSLLSRHDLPADVAQLIHTELAADYLSFGLLDRAGKEVEAARMAGPTDELLARFGERTYLRLRQWDTACEIVKAYGKRSKLDVSDRLGMIRCKEAEFLWSQEQFKEAYAAYKKAIQADEHCLPAYLGCCRYHRHLGKPDKAHRFLQKNLAFFKHFEWLALRELVKIAIASENKKVVFDFADPHLQAEPHDWRTRAELGKFLVELGQLKEAASAYFQCLEDAPHALVLHQHIWRLILRERQPEKTFKLYYDHARQIPEFSATYECRACRYHSRDILWQCPSCYRIKSFKERQI